jgi:predicted helicase
MATKKTKASRSRIIRTRQTIDFEEIKNWQDFENLVADYFTEVQKEEKSIIDVRVKRTGVGSDGGRDIFITFRLTDSIISFERKWVVQCKFYSNAVSKGKLSSVNIPTLIHEYGASGYLLVCKNDVSSRVSDMFENLERECKFRYSYMFWSGSELLNRIRFKPVLVERYFPEHNAFLKLQKRRSKA